VTTGADSATADHRVVVTAGHVDHGKSTLVRTLTGREPDRLAEEQRRGLTIELGYAWTRLPPVDAAPGVTVAFVDVPGHERFVGTMLAGAGPAPAALLIVAADDGWSAQTEEHVDALDLLGVPGLAVAVTKADVAGPERAGEVAADVTSRLATTSLAGAPVEVLDGRSPAAAAAVGRRLVTGLARLPGAADHGRPRLWIDRAFPIGGAGTVVTGTLRDGTLHVGDRLRLLPAGAEVRVRELRCLDEHVDTAGPGTRVAANVVGVGHDEVARGDVLAGGGPWQVTHEVDAAIRALPGRRVEHTGAWRVHLGSASVSADVVPLTVPIEPGRPGIVRLRLDAPLAVVAGDALVLRESGRRATVAGGPVVDPSPPRTPRGRARREHRAELLTAVARATSPSERLRALLASAGGALPGRDALARAGVSATAARPDDIEVVGDHAVLRDALGGWVEVARAAVADGPRPPEQLVARLREAGVPAAVASALPDHLVAAGQLSRGPGGLTDPASASDAAAAHRGREAALLTALRAEPLSPPDLTATAREHGVDHRGVTTLVHAGEIVRCDKVAFTRDAVAGAVELLVGLEATDGPFTASDARRAWGTSRKYAIPLLEHLDRTGVTRFDGTHRTLTGHRPPA
jgi:selenocysteine-specific elongation factor